MNKNIIFIDDPHGIANIMDKYYGEVYTTILFDNSGINATPVIYDTAENSSCTYYAQPGVNTVNEIQNFNNDTGENISLYGIINYPEQCVNSIMEYYGIGEDVDEEGDK